MIEKLTPEQEECLPVFREKYLNIACDGKRIERDKMQEAINAVYAHIDKEPPLLVILQSPLQAMMAIKFMQTFAAEKTGGQLGDQLWGQLWDQLWDQLRGQLRDQLRGRLWDQLRGQLRDQLRGRLGDQLRGRLGDQLRGQLWDQLWGQKIYNGNYLYGTQDLYWIAWGRFAEHIGVKLEKETQKRLTIMENISTQCEWWWPYEGVCFVSEKPTEINWDGDVLHGEGKPAVLYEDGYAVYSWRGTNVPKEWIENPDSITPETALNWENVEQRRCAAEIVGWHKVLEKLSAKSINKDEDPQIGELLEADIPDIGKERFLKVECGTGRTFALPVPPDTNTALDAQAWLNFCTPEDILNLEHRT